MYTYYAQNYAGIIINFSYNDNRCTSCTTGYIWRVNYWCITVAIAYGKVMYSPGFDN